MATQLQIINNIMVRLREPIVTGSTGSSYATVVSAIVANSYEEVLDEWNWRPVVKNYFINVPAGAGSVSSVSTESFGDAPDGRMVLVREQGRGFAYSYVDPLILDQGGLVTNITEFFEEHAVPMKELTLPDLSDVRLRQGISTPKEAPSTHFAIRPLPNETVEFVFNPISTQKWTFTVSYYQRPSRLATDSSTDSVSIEIPFRPVEELAMMYILNERGEEIGEPGNLAERRYMQALSTAKELDIKAGEHSNAYDWRRD